MAKNKTQETDANVTDFIASFANTEQKKKDSFELINLMQSVTGFEPKMWGPSIIGFGPTTTNMPADTKAMRP